ncbi:MAG: RecX family transcriptional regulator [Saprospirales bacterium]|nr:RecX family transcriptional regulator [Saprospirales bacterium]MBK8921413.1 RecX family transcriptional regulator [Saprospirales bacterium]
MAFNHQSKRPAKALTPDEALARMESYCAYRDRCAREVRQKMKELGIRGDTAEQIYQVLENEGYVNEARFALAFAGGKFRVNRWGRVRIRLELQQRDVAPPLIRQALDSIDEAEYQTVLVELLEKKRQQYQVGTDPNGRSKAAAALIRAGFEPELVFQYL